MKVQINVSDPSEALHHSGTSLRIQLLGCFRVWTGPRAIPDDAWRRRKAASLMKLLALAPQHRLHREEVLESLWPEYSPVSALNNLHRTIHTARHLLEPYLAPGERSAFLRMHSEVILLQAEGYLQVDVDQFTSAAQTADRSQNAGDYEAAIDLYTGELLPEDQYEDWVVAHGEHLRRIYQGLLRTVSSIYVGRGEYLRGLHSLQRLAAVDSTDEDAHIELMRVYALAGRRGEALRQYEELNEVLRREVNTEPDTTATRLYENIRADTARPLSDRSLTVPTPSTPGVRLDSKTERSFVGRDREIREVLLLLATSRFITLTGAGGIGKSRLGRHVAGSLMNAYRDDVYHVQLAPVSDPRLVPEAVARAVGMVEKPDQSTVEALMEYLAGRRMLLVLDNCEHMLEACVELVTELLSRCAHVSVIATSRRPLHGAGEVVYQVPALTLPAKRADIAEAEMLTSDAVRLFLERARQANESFVVSDKSVVAVAEICRSLDGIPLALELAAARLRVLTVQQLSARLHDSLSTLAVDRRAGLPHHRTLHATLDWSHDLLGDEERTVFRRLAIFAGGWSLEAAEAVCSGDDIPPWRVLDLLALLIDHSLVEVAERDEAMRYRFLEPVRHYARERLKEASEESQIVRKHADWFARLTVAAEMGLKGRDQVAWLTRLEMEHDNLRVALAWSLESGEIERGLEIASRIWRFWQIRGHWHEGRRWLDELLIRERARGRASHWTWRAEVLLGAGLIATNQSEFEAAGRYLAESVSLYRDAGDRSGEAIALDGIGTIARDRLDYEQSLAAHQAALAAIREIDDRWGTAWVLGSLTRMAVEAGQYEQAVAWGTESAVLRRELGDVSGLATVLGDVGQARYYQRQYALATELVTESLSLHRTLGMPSGIAFGLLRLAVLALLQDEDERAAPLVAESLVIFHRIGAAWGIAGGLSGAAWIFGRLGHAERGARLLGAYERYCERSGLLVGPGEQFIMDLAIGGIQAQLSPTEFQQACEAGRSMSLHDAIDQALSVRTVPWEPAPPDAQATMLTPREAEVAALIARGLTNREIATDLGITHETARVHVRNLLRKLGVASRREVAAWAKQHLLSEAGAIPKR